VATEFNGRPQKYTVEEPVVSSFTMAKKEWDDRIGNARVQAYNWRMIAFMMGVITLLAISGLIIQSTKATVAPYIVEIGEEGRVAGVGKVNDVKYTPKQEQIKHFLNELIMKTRSVSADSVVYKQNWLSAYTFLTPKAAAKMGDIMQKENQVARLEKKQTVQVQVKVINPIADNTYEIRWSEEVFDMDGHRTELYNMTGVFSIELATPKNEKEIMNNPLGIYIKDLAWSKEI
jgi:type IV secretion system protein VirB5